jgi:3-oxoadipate enol-lactonase
MPYADVRDIQMYYELQGTGPRLLFISGSGGDLRRQPNVFQTPLAKAFTVLAFDQRGLGRTSIPDEPYTMQDYAEDANALLDAVGWDTCLVAGTSFGGMVGQEFAVRFPERIERLVLNCTSSGGAGKPSYPLHTLVEMDPETKFRTTLAISDTRRNAAWQASHPDEVAVMLEQALAMAQIGAEDPGHAMGARRQLEARRDLDVYERLSSVTLPVLVCSGKYDGIAPPENGAAIASQLVNGRQELFEGGHMFYIQDKSAYPRMIEFLMTAAETVSTAGAAAEAH